MRARVMWFTPEMGGRKSGPPPGPEYRPTGIFLEPATGTVMPPASSLHASVVFTFVEHRATESIVDLDYLAPELVEPFSYPGSTFLVMEGPQAVGFARMMGSPQNPS